MLNEVEVIMAIKKDNPFNLLLEDMKSGKTNAGTGLNFGSLLKSNNKRQEVRTATFGYIDIFDLNKKLITKAVLRNVSPGGIGIEILPIPLKPQLKVMIELGGAVAEFGKIKCTITFVASIDSHPNQHKMVGLKFDSTSGVFKTKMEAFIKALSAVK